MCDFILIILSMTILYDTKKEVVACRCWFQFLKNVASFFTSGMLTDSFSSPQDYTNYLIEC